MTSTFSRLAEATPPGRERYVDFLRAFSICVVVLGHWLIAIIHWDRGEISGVNALEVVPGLWLATWVLQVMPVFFFVGGFSNLVSYDSVVKRGGGYVQFLYDRIRRLMRPTVVLLAVWIAVSAVLERVAVTDPATLHTGTLLLGRPLWFIGIYLIVVALSPAMLRLHRRFRAWVPVLLAGGALAVDLVDVGAGVAYVGYLNFAFVWLFAHQLGFFYADGTLGRISRPAFLLPALGGLVVLVALTTAGPYQASMVGLTGERSNTNPPTVAIVALTLWQVGLVMILRDRITAWLGNLRAWAAVIALNAFIMTIFLWHQTAMVLGTLLLFPLGFPQPVGGSPQWWALRPVWLFTLAALLGLLVVLFGRFERVGTTTEIRRRPEEGDGAARRRSTGAETAAAALGAAFVVVGVLGFAVGGFDGLFRPEGPLLIVIRLNPLQNVLHLLVGGILLVGANRGARGARGALLVAAISLGAIGLLGLYVVGRPSVNLLALNRAGSVFHLAGAAAALAVILAARVRKAPA